MLFLCPSCPHAPLPILCLMPPTMPLCCSHASSCVLYAPFSVPNKNLKATHQIGRPNKILTCPDDISTCPDKTLKNTKTFYSRFMAILNLSNILERIFLTKSMNETYENIPVKI